MNTKLIVGVVLAVAVIVMIGFTLFTNSEPEAPVGTYVDEDFVPTRPDVQARPDTFTVMTPEQKAAAEEAERIAAEQAALIASTTATSTATTTDEGTEEATEEPVE
jgi:type IV secretory pathway protease TraF